jgi:hypothetical protein
MPEGIRVLSLFLAVHPPKSQGYATKVIIVERDAPPAVHYFLQQKRNVRNKDGRK